MKGLLLFVLGFAAGALAHWWYSGGRRTNATPTLSAPASPPRASASPRPTYRVKKRAPAGARTATQLPVAGAAASADEVEEREFVGHWVDLDDPAAQTSPPPAPPTSGEGALEERAIRQAIEAVRPKVRACYERGLKRDPTLAGTLVVSFRIAGREGRGRIENPTVDAASTFHDPDVRACSLRALGEAFFPSPGDDLALEVTFPFRFVPVEK